VEQRVFRIRLPMRIKTSSKKRQALNLNVYRNLHFRSLSAQKNKFYEIATKLLKDVPPLGVITLHYDVFPQTKRRLDIMNPGSIVDKYFSDTLTETGVILDDDLFNIPHVSFAFGGYAEEEHILVTITEIEPRKVSTPMRVLLDHDDIQSALTTYVSTLNIPNASGVKLEADHSGNITAEVMFVPTSDPVANEIVADVTEEEPKPKKRGRGGRPPGSKNKPKTQEESADVETPDQDGPDSDGGGTDPSAEGESTPDVATPEEAPAPKGTSRKNLFGGEENPSSEDDGQAEATPSDTPEPVKPARGSIFDS